METAKAGSASPEDVLKFLPVEAQGVFFVDIQRAMQTEVANKMIQEDDNYQEYLKFVEESGIDPKEDIFYVALGLLSSGLGKQEGAAVVNLRYDKEKLLALIEEKVEGEIATEDYNGITVYSPESEDEEAFAFLDASHMVIGNSVSIQSCIDVMQKTKDNVFKNEGLAGVLDRTDKDTIFWGAMLVPKEDMAKAAEENAQLKPLQNMNALVLNFDHKNAMVTVKIKAEGDDPDGNQQIADMLNGLKAMGAMMIPEDKPELNDLLSSVTVSHAADHVMIDVSIPDEVLQKLKEELPTQEKEEKK
jgi:rRNA processing protein Krr1/Pno1